DAEAPPAPGPTASGEAIRPANKGHVTARDKARHRREERTAAAPAQPAEPAADTVSEAPVTWLRRLRWVTLALVPSSLMLGATTPITPAIPALPLLWVLPLALYLLTFIIVSAHISPRTQSYVVFGATATLLAATAYWLVPFFFSTDAYVWILRVIAIVLIAL